MKKTLQSFPIEKKQIVDELFLSDLVDMNRTKVISNEFKGKLSEVMNINDKKIITAFLRFWDIHNDFNNNFVDELMSKKTDLSVKDLELLQQTFIFSNKLDFEGLPLSGILKEKSSYLLTKIQHIYNKDLNGNESLKPHKGSFFIKYKKSHLTYLLLEKTHHPHFELFKKKLVGEYHSGDEELFKIRLDRDFFQFYNVNIDELEELIQACLPSSKTINGEDEKVLDKILELDNFVEYKFINQLQGLPARQLKYYLIELLKKEGIEVEGDSQECIIASLDQLIQQKRHKLVYQVQGYQQTGLTCSASCLLMGLNYFNKEKMFSEKEKEIANFSSSEFISGQHFSGVGLFALNSGLKPKLIHTDENLFNNPGLSDGFFEILMEEYRKYLNTFLKEGGLLTFDDIDIKVIITELQKGNIIILAGQEGDILHAKLVIGYDLLNGKLYTIDPLIGKMQQDSFYNISQFLSTPLGKWMLTIQKPLRKDGDMYDNEGFERLQRYQYQCDEFIKDTYKKDMLINLPDMMFYDYRTYGSKGYNLSILKNYGFNVADGVIINNSIIDSINKGTLSEEEVWNLKQEIHRKLGNILIVRSNFIGEDSGEKSFAGHFSSFLHVSPEEVVEKIKEVLNSDKTPLGLKKGVLIQKMIYGDYSGVAFISDQSLDVEIVEGLNENLVNGSVSPIRLQLLDNNTLSSKSTNLPPQMLSELQSSMIQINQIFNKSMDVEFTIKGDKIYVLQARPITINYDYKIESSKLLSNIGCFNHIIVSKGSFSGKFIVITSEGDIQKIKEDSIIVVTDKLYQGFIPKLHKIKGIIAEHGGQLAHLAIVGREMKVPIISDCVGIVDKLKDTTYTFLTYDQEALSFK